jgi:hypothetical protein
MDSISPGISIPPYYSYSSRDFCHIAIVVFIIY